MAPVESDLQRSDRVGNFNKDTIKKGDSKRINFPNGEKSRGQAFVRCDCRDEYGEASIQILDPLVKGYLFDNIFDEEPKEIVLPTQEPIRFTGEQRIELIYESTSPAHPEIKLTLKHKVAQHQEIPHIKIEQVISLANKLLPSEPQLHPADSSIG